MQFYLKSWQWARLTCGLDLLPRLSWSSDIPSISSSWSNFTQILDLLPVAFILWRPFTIVLVILCTPAMELMFLTSQVFLFLYLLHILTEHFLEKGYLKSCISAHAIFLSSRLADNLTRYRIQSWNSFSSITVFLSYSPFWEISYLISNLSLSFYLFLKKS